MPRAAAMILRTASIVAALALAVSAGGAGAAASAAQEAIVQAAQRGADSSQVQLAVAYLNGSDGIARDPAKAVYWFEQAAIQGNAYAEARLGDLYADGVGVRQNPVVAFDWRLKAARRGDVDAQLGVGRDAEQADYWFRRAALEGNAEAQALLAGLHRYGDDAEVARASSRSAFERAALRGYEFASHIVDLVADLGYWIAEDWHHRLPGLETLARDGDVEAAFQLGRRYETGSGGVRRDDARALAWYRQAAAGGHQQAMRALARLRSGAVGAAGAPLLAARPEGHPN